MKVSFGLIKKQGFTIVFIFVLSQAAFSELIGDFAPLKIGTKWSYLYKYDSSNPIRSDSIVVAIEIRSKTTRGADTLYFLKINKQGNSYRYPSPIQNILNEYIDTVITQGDSVALLAPVIPSAIYDANPFWTSHQIKADSLKKDKFGFDSLLSYQKKTNSSSITTQIIYIQNMGLYNYLYSNPGSSATHSSCSIQLLSFNDRPFPSTIKIPDKNILANKIRTFTTSRLFLSNFNRPSNCNTFTINGRMSPTNGIPAQGIVIERLVGGSSSK